MATGNYKVMLKTTRAYHLRHFIEHLMHIIESQARKEKKKAWMVKKKKE